MVRPFPSRQLPARARRGEMLKRLKDEGRLADGGQPYQSTSRSARPVEAGSQRATPEVSLADLGL